MNYLDLEEMDDAGNMIPMGVDEALRARGFGVHSQSFPAVRSNPGNRNPRDEYWKHNAPVLELVDYNTESLMLPKLAPRDEKDVSVKKVILDRTIDTIQNHQGGSKVNWVWKVNLLDSRLAPIAPATYTQVKNILLVLTTRTTAGVYTYSDATLHGNDLRTELAIDDAADNTIILAASRAACRFIAMTLTFTPTAVVPNGAMINAAELPEATSIRIYFRAPMNPGCCWRRITRWYHQGNIDDHSGDYLQHVWSDYVLVFEEWSNSVEG